MEQIAADRNAVATATERRAKFFRGLADQSRLAILDALCAGPLVVHEIVGRTALTQPNVSNHWVWARFSETVASAISDRNGSRT